MTENPSIQHLPAVKVGGRRLSVSTKHKPPVTSEATPPSSASPPDEPILDYPRPAPPGDEQVHDRRLHEEDLPPKREKKQGAYDSDKMKEYAHWKADNTRPTRDSQGGNKAFGGAGRIAQPAGKPFIN